MPNHRSLAALLVFLLLLPLSGLAQTRGQGRIAGKVLDDKGQPLADVTIRATRAGEAQPVEGKTNDKGEFTLNQLSAGDWTLEFTKPGYQPQRGPLTLPEGSGTQRVDVTLAVDQPDPNVELQAELKTAEGLMRGGQYAEARKVYEGLLTKHPTVYQLHRFVAAAYAGEKNYPKATEHVRAILEKDPNSTENKILLADLLIEQGLNDEGLVILQSVSMAEVKDPFPFINGAIALIRGNKAEEAIELLNKLMAQFPSQPELYYYRARAYVTAKKLPEAKADLEKFVATAPPDARELGDAKKILEQLKDIK